MLEACGLGSSPHAGINMVGAIARGGILHSHSAQPLGVHSGFMVHGIGFMIHDVTLECRVQKLL